MHETRRFDEVSVGEGLPPLEVDVTATSIVAGAIATRDFNPVHHDVEPARAQGAANIFMNILTSNGLVERYVATWAGPDALLRAVKIRLGEPNYPGDVMTMTGEVIGRAEDGGGWIEVRVRGQNQRGVHVSGTVRLDLPGSTP